MGSRAMEIILLERIENLGQMGDLVRVRPGFARNYLLPERKALRATAANRRLFESRRAQLEAENLKLRGEAEAVATKMEGLTIAVIRQAGETGILYGSVSPRDIAEMVTGAGYTIQRTQVVLNAPIKETGLHPVRVRLHPEVAVTVTVNVARSEDEAELQKKRGSAVTGMDLAAQEEAEAAAAAAAEAAADAELAKAEEAGTAG